MLPSWIPAGPGAVASDGGDRTSGRAAHSEAISPDVPPGYRRCASYGDRGAGGSPSPAPATARFTKNTYPQVWQVTGKRG